MLSREGRRVEIPTAAALFPAEFLSWPPRSYVERVYNITLWTEMPRGGNAFVTQWDEPSDEFESRPRFVV